MLIFERISLSLVYLDQISNVSLSWIHFLLLLSFWTRSHWSSFPFHSFLKNHSKHSKKKKKKKKRLFLDEVLRDFLVKDFFLGIFSLKWIFSGRDIEADLLDIDTSLKAKASNEIVFLLEDSFSVFLQSEERFSFFLFLIDGDGILRAKT